MVNTKFRTRDGWHQDLASELWRNEYDAELTTNIRSFQFHVQCKKIIFRFTAKRCKNKTPFSYVVKGKDETALVDAIKVYEGSDILSPLILNLDNRWRGVANVTPGKNPGTQWKLRFHVGEIQ